MFKLFSTDKVEVTTKLAVPRLTSDPVAPNNGEIWYNTTTNKFRGFQAGSATDLIGSGGGGGSGADTDLSNLTATSINQSLNPAASGTHTLGTSSNSWAATYTAGLYLTDPSGVSLQFHPATSGQVNHAYYWPATQGGANQVLQNDGSGVLSWVTPGLSGGGLTWTKYTLDHTDFQVANPTYSIDLFSLPAKGTIQAIVIRPTIEFAGSSITSYKFSIGIATNTTKYTSEFECMTTIDPDTALYSTSGNFESFTGATAIKISAVATGANLDQSTAGEVEVYVLASTLP